MLKILHKGIQYSGTLDTTGFTGDVAHDSQLPSITKLVSGRLASVTTSGTITLADGADLTTIPIGFIINDAAGYFYENKPAIASGKIPTTMGNTVVITDQIDTTKTFTPGQLLYAGTGPAVGLVTNVAPHADSTVIGVSDSAASAAAPELKILRV